MSDFELEVMAGFWRATELSAPQVFESLGADRGVTYSTIKTIIDRLEAKGALERTRSNGRTIFYKSAIQREKIRKPLLTAFVRRAYGEDLRPLFAHLIRDRRLSEVELDYLRRLLEEKEDEQGSLK